MAKQTKDPLKSETGHHIVLVEWLDSCSPGRKWQDSNASDDYRAAVCRSVGWLGRRDKDNVVLYASTGPQEIGDITAIPAQCVRRIRRLK